MMARGIGMGVANVGGAAPIGGGRGCARHLCSNYPREMGSCAPPGPTDASILHKYDPSLQLPNAVLSRVMSNVVSRP